MFADVNFCWCSSMITQSISTDISLTYLVKFTSYTTTKNPKMKCQSTPWDRQQHRSKNRKSSVSKGKSRSLKRSKDPPNDPRENTPLRYKHQELSPERTPERAIRLEGRCWKDRPAVKRGTTTPAKNKRARHVEGGYPSLDRSLAVACSIYVLVAESLVSCLRSVWCFRVVRIVEDEDVMGGEVSPRSGLARLFGEFPLMMWLDVCAYFFQNLEL